MLAWSQESNQIKRQIKRICILLYVNPLWIVSSKAYDAYTVCCRLEYCIVLRRSTWKPVLVKKFFIPMFRIKKKINSLKSCRQDSATLPTNTPQACRAQNCWNTASMWWSSSAVNRRFSRVTMYCWIIWWCWQIKKKSFVFYLSLYKNRKRSQYI